MKPKKKIISETVDELSSYDFEGSIESAIKRLQDLLEKYPNARLDYGQHDRWSDSYSYAVKIDRTETDQEYNARMALEKQEKDTQLEYLQRNAANLGYDLVKKSK